MKKSALTNRGCLDLIKSTSGKNQNFNSNSKAARQLQPNKLKSTRKENYIWKAQIKNTGNKRKQKPAKTKKPLNQRLGNQKI
ncbi:hypothetical protein ACS5PU_16575 [Pedobacter sp. GSP4]|uniref:hypothetical protein n=1 Tax=Pedobacter sp. GSP4 TaxID=3453716 RepID=UPI003EECFEED